MNDSFRRADGILQVNVMSSLNKKLLYVLSGVT
jgi:hypothetical protein